MSKSKNQGSPDENKTPANDQNAPEKNKEVQAQGTPGENKTHPDNQGSSAQNELPANNQSSSKDKNDQEKKTGVVIRHKTTYKHYRRAGIVLEQIAKPYSVTDAQLDVLKKDPHVEIAG